MATEDMDELTNIELEQRLDELGIPNQGVTEANRLLYIKKLERKQPFRDETIASDNTSQIIDPSSGEMIRRSHPKHIGGGPEKSNRKQSSKKSESESETMSRKYMWGVSMFLAFVFIFGVCYIMYSRHFPDFFEQITAKKPSITFCEDLDSDTMYREESCIHKYVWNDALLIVQKIVAIYANEINMNYCKFHDHLPSVALRELYTSLGNVGKISTDLVDGIDHLLEKNSQFNIIMYRPKFECDPSDTDCIDEYNESVQFSFAFKALQGICKLKRQKKGFFWSIGIASVVVLGILIMHIVRQQSEKKRLNKQKIKDRLVAEIRADLLRNLGQEVEKPGTSEVIIEILRLRITPSYNFDHIETIWEEAVQAVRKERDVAFSSIVFGGETYQTICWSPQVRESILNHYASRWRAALARHKYASSFVTSPCLKIKNLFTKSDLKMPRLEEEALKAILAKTYSSCKILDLKVDRKNMAVHLRCASEKDAFALFQNVHTCFYENRPITVRFIDLERYNRRYSPYAKSFIY